MPRKLLFESVTCSRCGGTGNYSYCQMHGTTCFKCAGDGAVLTKRGRATQKWFAARRMVPLTELKPGDSYLLEGIPGFVASKWIKVTAIEAGENGHVAVVGVDKLDTEQRYNGDASSMVRKAMTNDAVKALKLEALAYQATLTKTGTVRKCK